MPAPDLHQQIELSLLAPAHNEQDNVQRLVDESGAALEAATGPGRYEFVIVDDGSTDQTRARITALMPTRPWLRCVAMTQTPPGKGNGQSAAFHAGVRACRGRLIATIDADLQNDPADIPALVRKLEDGFDVVSGWRKDRQDPLSRVVTSRCANWLISLVSGVPLHDYGCSLKAYRRDVIADVRLYGEMHRFIPIYARMSGGRVTEMVVGHRPRKKGRSKYGFERVFKVVLDLLVVKFFLSFAAKPIYVFGGFGILCLLASLIPAGLAVFYKLSSGDLHKDFVETPLPIVAATLALVGSLATLQGIIAEVLMRTYFESQGRRPYRVKALVELDSKRE